MTSQDSRITAEIGYLRGTLDAAMHVAPQAAGLGRLRRALDALEAVLGACQDRNGSPLPAETQVPVEQFQTALATALLDRP